MKQNYSMIFSILILTTILGATTACRQHEGAYAGRSYGNFEEKKSVYVMDHKLHKVLAIDNLQYQKLPHGAIQVDTILRNRLKKPVAVECSTEFKSAANFGIGDVTGWRVFVLQPMQAITYTSMSTSTNAEKFTVHIRPATK